MHESSTKRKTTFFDPIGFEERKTPEHKHSYIPCIHSLDFETVVPDDEHTYIYSTIISIAYDGTTPTVSWLSIRNSAHWRPKLTSYMRANSVGASIFLERNCWKVGIEQNGIGYFAAKIAQYFLSSHSTRLYRV